MVTLESWTVNNQKRSFMRIKVFETRSDII